MAEESLAEGGKWYSLGLLVHNDEVVDYFKARGLEPVETLEQIEDCKAGIIVRSHGISPGILETAQQKGLKIKDATCPLVKRIHEIVSSLRDDNYDIVIFGDRNHPEVEAIAGWSGNKTYIAGNISEARNIKAKNLGVVSQTTKDERDYHELIDTLLSQNKDVKVFDTICPATRQRQQAARELCRQVDVMLVIGDRKSSNTTTLYKECQDTGVSTFQIQNAEEIEEEWFKAAKTVGITAGASTPDWIIKEVLDRMTDYQDMETRDAAEDQGERVETKADHPEPENIERSQEESFAKMEAEMAEFVPPSKGDIIKGLVIQVLDDEVMVDVGGKSEGIIPLREMSNQDIDSARDLVKVGDEIEVMVLKWDDDGTILLSRKKVEAQRALDSLEEDFNEGRVIKGVISGSVKGGLLVDVGITAFLPASHVEDGYVRNLDEYIGKEMQFKIIEFNRNKRRGSQIVLSRKDLVAEEKTRLKKDFWESIAEGQTRTGRVKRVVDYGAFIDLGGYEGLLHVSEMDHKRVEHPSDIMQEGQEIEVYILGVDREKERVSLSRKKLLKSPWELFLEQNHEGDIIEGTVVRTAPFGAFVELQPGVDGLIHISQLANRRIDKPEDVVSINQKIMVKILNIDEKEKRVGLSLRAAQEDQEQQEANEYMEEQEKGE